MSKTKKTFLSLGALILIILVLIICSGRFWAGNCDMPIGMRAQMPDESNEQYRQSIIDNRNSFLEKRPKVCDTLDMIFPFH